MALQLLELARHTTHALAHHIKTCVRLGVTSSHTSKACPAVGSARGPSNTSSFVEGPAAQNRNFSTTVGRNDADRGSRKDQKPREKRNSNDTNIMPSASKASLLARQLKKPKGKKWFLKDKVENQMEGQHSSSSRLKTGVNENKARVITPRPPKEFSKRADLAGLKAKLGELDSADMNVGLNAIRSRGVEHRNILGFDAKNKISDIQSTATGALHSLMRSQQFAMSSNSNPSEQIPRFFKTNQLQKKNVSSRENNNISQSSSQNALNPSHVTNVAKELGKALKRSKTENSYKTFQNSRRPTQEQSIHEDSIVFRKNRKPGNEETNRTNDDMISKLFPRPATSGKPFGPSRETNEMMEIRPSHVEDLPVTQASHPYAPWGWDKMPTMNYTSELNKVKEVRSTNTAQKSAAGLHKIHGTNPKNFILTTDKTKEQQQEAADRVFQDGNPVRSSKDKPGKSKLDDHRSSFVFIDDGIFGSAAPRSHVVDQTHSKPSAKRSWRTQHSDYWTDVVEERLAQLRLSALRKKSPRDSRIFVGKDAVPKYDGLIFTKSGGKAKGSSKVKSDKTKEHAIRRGILLHNQGNNKRYADKPTQVTELKPEIKTPAPTTRGPQSTYAPLNKPPRDKEPQLRVSQEELSTPRRKSTQSKGQSSTSHIPASSLCEPQGGNAKTSKEVEAHGSAAVPKDCSKVPDVSDTDQWSKFLLKKMKAVKKSESKSGRSTKDALSSSGKSIKGVKSDGQLRAERNTDSRLNRAARKGSKVKAVSGEEEAAVQLENGLKPEQKLTGLPVALGTAKRQGSPVDSSSSTNANVRKSDKSKENAKSSALMTEIKDKWSKTFIENFSELQQERMEQAKKQKQETEKSRRQTKSDTQMSSHHLAASSKSPKTTNPNVKTALSPSQLYLGVPSNNKPMSPQNCDTKKKRELGVSGTDNKTNKEFPHCEAPSYMGTGSLGYWEWLNCRDDIIAEDLWEIKDEKPSTAAVSKGKTDLSKPSSVTSPPTSTTRPLEKEDHSRVDTDGKNKPLFGSRDHNVHQGRNASPVDFKEKSAKIKLDIAPMIHKDMQETFLRSAFRKDSSPKHGDQLRATGASKTKVSQPLDANDRGDFRPRLENVDKRFLEVNSILQKLQLATDPEGGGPPPYCREGETPKHPLLSLDGLMAMSLVPDNDVASAHSPKAPSEKKWSRGLESKEGKHFSHQGGESTKAWPLLKGDAASGGNSVLADIRGIMQGDSLRDLLAEERRAAMVLARHDLISAYRKNIRRHKQALERYRGKLRKMEQEQGPMRNGKLYPRRNLEF
ncbi:uncharacterized protein LOC101848900 [Aplysia californica]|uniref:Uncharacterized protein LOC101848900 n=1 Tax=Aplysia californica TaxID=6500 RepID=A0ABM0JWL7_APLCA|nr:uncharacterized protein LOC101848900 [Aplysia californica]XP_005103237.1 uncharacterized protein LOC101848900 [Aplysia californica]XP_005103238.1 uncharacterized protein LOC101848900 [Aplysia californica]